MLTAKAEDGLTTRVTPPIPHADSPSAVEHDVPIAVEPRRDGCLICGTVFVGPACPVDGFRWKDAP